MSEPVDLVEQELQLVNEIEQLAEEQYALKVTQRQNNVAVRAWRINVMRRVEKENSVSGLTEDEYKIAKKLENEVNNDLDELSGISLDSKINVDKAGLLVKSIKENIKRLRNDIQSHGFDTVRLSEIYTVITDRWNELKGEFEEQFKIRKIVEEENQEIKERNAKTTEEEKQYMSTIDEIIAAVNRKLNPLIPDGNNYATWNSTLKRIDLANENEVAKAYANKISQKLLNQWGTVNLAFLNEIPEELRGYLEEKVGSDMNLLSNTSVTSQAVSEYIDIVLSSINQPDEPHFEYEKLKPVPVIEMLFFETEDIELDELDSKMIRSGNKIPEEIVQEIQNYRKGKFVWTVKNADRINEIANEYGLLGIDVTQNNEKQSTRRINGKIRELIAIQDSFGSERNSRTGQSRINEFVTATRDFLQHSHNQQKVFETYYEDFLDTAKNLEDWVNRSWWQFGGQPENHHGAGKGDSSEISYQKKNHGSKYSGPTL